MLFGGRLVPGELEEMKAGVFLASPAAVRAGTGSLAPFFFVLNYVSLKCNINILPSPGCREATGSRVGPLGRGCILGPQLSPHWLSCSEPVGSGGEGILAGSWSLGSASCDSQEGAAAGPLLLGLHVVSDLEAGLIGPLPGSVFQLP